MEQASARQRGIAEVEFVSIRFLADADLDAAIVRGVRRREPAIDFKSATDAVLEGLPDPEVLDLAATEGRILVSHDTSTLSVHFIARLHLGLKNPGVLAFQSANVADVIESLLIVWSASREQEWIDQIHYLPSLSRHVFH